MHQRGQLSEGALHYLIVMVCVGVILGVGYSSFSSVSDRLCKTETSKFQLDVKGKSTRQSEKLQLRFLNP